MLDPAAVQAYYDRFGKKQDSQGFYEDLALVQPLSPRFEYLSDLPGYDRGED